MVLLFAPPTFMILIGVYRRIFAPFYSTAVLRFAFKTAAAVTCFMIFAVLLR